MGLGQEKYGVNAASLDQSNQRQRLFSLASPISVGYAGDQCAMLEISVLGWRSVC